MKRMYKTEEIKDNRIIISIDRSKLNKRNELHFAACQNSNVAYVSKNKKRIIPRKQKYKNGIDY